MNEDNFDYEEFWEEPLEPDPDEAYERMRDDAGDRLEDMLKGVHEALVRGENLYYKNSNLKFMEHAIETLKRLTNTELYYDFDSKQVRVRANRGMEDAQES